MVEGSLINNITVPTSKSPGTVADKLAMVDFPTPAFPNITFAVSLPMHELVMTPLLSS